MTISSLLPTQLLQTVLAKYVIVNQPNSRSACRQTVFQGSLLTAAAIIGIGACTSEGLTLVAELFCKAGKKTVGATQCLINSEHLERLYQTLPDRPLAYRMQRIVSQALGIIVSVLGALFAAAIENDWAIEQHKSLRNYTPQITLPPPRTDIAPPLPTPSGPASVAGVPAAARPTEHPPLPPRPLPRPVHNEPAAPPLAAAGGPPVPPLSPQSALTPSSAALPPVKKSARPKISFGPDVKAPADEKRSGTEHTPLSPRPLPCPLPSEPAAPPPTAAGGPPAPPPPPLLSPRSAVAAREQAPSTTAQPKLVRVLSGPVPAASGKPKAKAPGGVSMGGVLRSEPNEKEEKTRGRPEKMREELRTLEGGKPQKVFIFSTKSKGNKKNTVALMLGGMRKAFAGSSKKDSPERVIFDAKHKCFTITGVTPIAFAENRAGLDFHATDNKETLTSYLTYLNQALPQVGEAFRIETESKPEDHFNILITKASDMKVDELLVTFDWTAESDDMVNNDDDDESSVSSTGWESE